MGVNRMVDEGDHSHAERTLCTTVPSKLDKHAHLYVIHTNTLI